MISLFNKIVGGTAVLALSFTLFSTSSLAAETGAELTGGDVSLSTVTAASFGVITLDGTTQTFQAPLNTFDVTDARGTGAGWNVSVVAGQFTDSTSGRIMDAGSLAIDAPAVNLKDAGSSALSTITQAGGVLDNGTGVKLLSAAVDGGMGSYTVDPASMTLTLKPGKVYAGNYTSTVTVSLTTGP